MLKQPLRCHKSQTIERMTQRFSHTHKSIDGTNGCPAHASNRCVVSRGRMPPASLLEHRQHHCQKPFFGVAFHQSRAEFAEDRGIKAGISEFES
jgi:hypothetical protein